jgi:hypothetical protein
MMPPVPCVAEDAGAGVEHSRGSAIKAATCMDDLSAPAGTGSMVSRMMLTMVRVCLSMFSSSGRPVICRSS